MDGSSLCVVNTLEPQISTLRCPYLHDAVTDGAVLPLPQKHQADHDHSCYGHGNHQQANQCAAPEAEVLSQGAVGLLTGRAGGSETEREQ